MTLVRHSASLVVVALSILGLLLCITVAAGAWAAKRKLDSVNVAVFGTADDAFAFMEARLDRAGQALNAGRPRVNRVSAFAEQLKTRTGDVRAELEPLVRTLDETFEQLKSAETGLDATRAIAQRVNRLSEAIASARPADESAGASAAQIAELSASFAAAIADLQTIRRELVEFRESGRLAREVAARIIDRAAGLNERLANTSEKISGHRLKVADARSASVNLGRRIRWWTGFAAALVVLGSLWFAMSQLAVIRLARRPARRLGLMANGDRLSSVDSDSAVESEGA